MSKKKVDLACESCDSEFQLVYKTELVTESSELVCPFCSQVIEENTNEEDEEDSLEEEFKDMWE